MNHHEEAMARYEAGEYDEALDAFEAAIEAEEESAALWRDIGRTHAQLENWEAAEEAYDHAAELDEQDALTWYGKGVVYQATNRTDMAAKAYETAILFDRDWALPWLSKGMLLLSSPGQGEEGLRYLRRAIALEDGKISPHILNLCAQLPSMPFLSYRLLRDRLLPWQQAQYQPYVQQTLEEVSPLRPYIGWYLSREGASPLIAGLCHYYAGDPEAALAFFEQAAEQSGATLQLRYYQSLASYECADSQEEAYTEDALPMARQYVTATGESGGWKFWKKKKSEAQQAPPLPEAEWEACYYAGLSLLEHDELDQALSCFERIEGDYLPALYQSMWVYEEKVNAKKKKQKAELLLQREAATPTFGSGPQMPGLSEDTDAFEAAVLAQARYRELAEAIEQLHFYAEFEKEEQAIALPKEQPVFFQAWQWSEGMAEKVAEEQQSEMGRRLRHQLQEAQLWAQTEQLLSSGSPLQDTAEWVSGYGADPAHCLAVSSLLLLNNKLEAPEKLLLDAYALREEEAIAEAVYQGAPFGNGLALSRLLPHSGYLPPASHFDGQEMAEKLLAVLREEQEQGAFTSFAEALRQKAKENNSGGEAQKWVAHAEEEE